MTIISKLKFYEKIGKDLQCRHLHYWEESCVKAHLSFVPKVFLGSMKFFLPIYTIKVLINYKKTKDKTFWKNILLEELRSAFYGVLMASTFLGFNCILCKCSGRLNYYNIGLISGMISGFSVLIETKENRLLDTLIFFNLFIEAIFKNLNSLNIFNLTDANETLTFMVASGMLMYLFQCDEKNSKYTNFWFYKPHTLKTRKETSNSDLGLKCEHKGACSQFALLGIRRYFLLGYGFSIVRKLIPRLLTVFQSPSKLYAVAVNRDNVKFGAFVAAYVGLYRYIMCYLLNTKKMEPKYLGAIAGTISGVTYYLSPNLQVLCAGISSVLQILYNTILRRMHAKNRQVPQQLVYMLAHGVLMHNAIMCKEICPTYYVNMLNTCTNNIFSSIYQKLIVKYIL